MIKTANSLAIVGCGWLGTPLAEIAINRGFVVKGSTTNESKIDVLRQMGVKPFLLNLPGEIMINSIFDAEYLVLNIPPGRRNPNVLHDYPLSIDQIIQMLQLKATVKKIIFISATSVYGSNHDVINEDTETSPSTDAGKAILNAEEIVMKSGISYVILRFGGLAGPGRHPGRFLSGKTNLSSGNQAINFLHLDDAIGAIFCFLSSKEERAIYNVIAPVHPLKKDFYARMSEMIGMTPPTFVDASDNYRREISPQKFMDDTNYQFKYPDPMGFRF